MNGATYAQIAQFEVFELAYCYVIPENTFYKYNPATGKYEAKEVNFIGRIKTQHNFVSDVNSYAQEGVYISDETNIWASSTFAFSHNLGFDYKNMRISTWIKDKTNGFIMPWEIDSILDYCFNQGVNALEAFANHLSGIVADLTQNSETIINALGEIKNLQQSPFIVWIVANERENLITAAETLNKFSNKDFGVFIFKASLNNDKIEFKCLLKPETKTQGQSRSCIDVNN